MAFSSKRTLLVIDDEKVFCNSVREYLESERLEVLAAHTAAKGLDACSARKIDIVLLDQKLPDAEGHALAPAILERNELTKIIFITAFPSFENAVKAVRLGVHDYLSKPFDPGALKLTVENALRTLDLEKVEQLQNYVREKERKEAVIIGASSGMAEVRHIAASASAIGSPVLVTGETGTGKTLVAQAIHYGSSLAKAPFISINCAALPENLIESELFGYEKGAFTGANGTKRGLIEMADGGTLFLDEIGEMPLHLQSKLLGVIEEQSMRRIGGTAVFPVQVRFLAATNSDLENNLGKTFRKDLYFRLSVVHIHIPPLRERSEDLADLCPHLVSQIAQGRTVRVADEDLAVLKKYDWPGNVRELKNILERSIFLQHGAELHPAEFLPAGRQRQGTGNDNRERPGPIKTLQESERENIRSALSQLSGNLTQTAKALGISLSTLKRKISEYGLK
jgi:DNA-binding NtrC family response regulator